MVVVFFSWRSFPTRNFSTPPFRFFRLHSKKSRIQARGTSTKHSTALSRRRAPVTCKSITRPNRNTKANPQFFPSSTPAPEAPKAAASRWRLQSRRTWLGAGSGGTAWTRSSTSFGVTLGRVVDFIQLGSSKLRDTSRWSFCSSR